MRCVRLFGTWLRPYDRLKVFLTLAYIVEDTRDSATIKKGSIRLAHGVAKCKPSMGIVKALQIRFVIVGGKTRLTESQQPKPHDKSTHTTECSNSFADRQSDVRSCDLLSAKLPLQPGRCQLLVSFAVNLLLAACEHVLRRDIPDGTVQAKVVVMVDVTLH